MVCVSERAVKEICDYTFSDFGAKSKQFSLSGLV